MVSANLYSTAKVSFDSIVGTSFFNDIIYTSVNKLKKRFGEPDECDLDGKVNYEWDLELRIQEYENDTEYRSIPFTIYDWKEGRIRKTDVIGFHIGARNKEESAIVKNYLTMLHL